jgi:hypothetical protein
MKTTIFQFIGYISVFFLVTSFSQIYAQILVQPYNIIDAENPGTGIYIGWKSQTDATVYYGVQDFNLSIIGSTRGTRLAGLTPGARYQYKVISNGDTSITGSFRTAPPPGTSFSFVIFGDTQRVGTPEIIYLQEIFDNFHPDLLFIAGDIIASDGNCPGSPPKNYCFYDSLFTHNPQVFANTVLVPVRGNHDAKTTYMSSFYMLPDSGLRYIFSYGSVYFLITDINDDFVFRDTNLDETFAALNSTFKVGVNHYPVHDWDESGSYLNYLWGNPFEKAGGQVWYNGHKHSYHRTHWIRSASIRSTSPADYSQSQKQGYAIYCSAGAPAGPLSIGSTANYVAAYNSTDNLYGVVTVDSVAKGIYRHKSYVHKSLTVFDSFTVIGNTVKPEKKAFVSSVKINLKVSPNPFSHSASFQLFVPKKMHLSIKIFDLKGKEIAKLTDRVFNAGKYSIPLPGKQAIANSLPSGVYCYRLKTPSFVVQKIFVKLR